MVSKTKIKILRNKKVLRDRTYPKTGFQTFAVRTINT